MFQVDYNRGDQICKVCGAVDHNRVLSHEEESRTFADDTTADKDKKKRAEARADGGLGTFIAGKAPRAGELPDPRVRALQRAQQRLQAPESTEPQGTEKSGPRSTARMADKTKDATRSKIADLASRAGIGGDIAQDAQKLFEEYLRRGEGHDRACHNPKCDLARTPRLVPDVMAAALLTLASKRSAEGEAATLSSLQFLPFLDAEHHGKKKIPKLEQHITALLAWNKARGCGGGAAGASGSKPVATPAALAVGLANTFISNLARDHRATMQLRQAVADLIHLESSASVIERRQPRSMAAAAVLVAYSDLVQAQVADIEALNITVETVAQQAGFPNPGTVIKTSRDLQEARAAATSTAAAATSAPLAAAGTPQA